MKKDLVWLHIGMHKTGSTAIQEGLKAYDDGVTRYARLGLANHSLLLTTLFNRRPAQQEMARRKGPGRLLHPLYKRHGWHSLRRELAQPVPNLILSGESMSHFDLTSMTALAEFLKDHAKAVRVLVYLRDPVSFAGSAFQQKVRGGSSELKLSAPSFRKVLKVSFGAFGRDAVEVAAYDRRAFGAGGVLADAARRMGVEPQSGAAVVANESLSAGAIGLLYFWNRTPQAAASSKWREAARRAMIERLAKAVPGKIRLAPSVAGGLVDPADLEWLLRQTGIDFRDCLTRQDAPGDVLTEADLRAARDAALPQLIAHLQVLGLKDIPTEADAVMSRLFSHILSGTSRFETLFKYVARPVS